MKESDEFVKCLIQELIEECGREFKSDSSLSSSLLFRLEAIFGIKELSKALEIIDSKSVTRIISENHHSRRKCFQVKEESNLVIILGNRCPCKLGIDCLWGMITAVAVTAAASLMMMLPIDDKKNEEQRRNGPLACSHLIAAHLGEAMGTNQIKVVPQEIYADILIDMD